MLDTFFSYVQSAPTPIHAATTSAEFLLSRGFVELLREHPFPDDLPPRFFLRLGGALFAFDTRGAFVRDGVTILAAHTDSPALKLKIPAVKDAHGVLIAPTEIYGAPIRATWLDQALGIAGSAYLASGNRREFVLSQRAVIPNLAIHLNRSVNEGFEFNPQEHLTAILGLAAEDEAPNGRERLIRAVADELAVSAEDIIELDAYFYDATAPTRIGMDGALYLSPRIDNLAGCFTCLESFAAASGSRPAMLALYNHEEIGSRTGEGALSGVILSLLRRVWTALGLSYDEQEQSLARSFLVSNDATHATHPNFRSKHDQEYACALNGGPAIKYSASHRYATTGGTAALFRNACRRAEVPVQQFITRSDMQSGSTVGPLGWAQTGIATLDIGVPILAMHSARETGGADDLELMTRALTAVLDRDG